MISRTTHQKKLIQEEINRFENFFSTEELHERLSKKDKNIGIATIYRYLKNEKEKRNLHSFKCENKQIYSKTNNIHAHFICQKCNKITHFELKDISVIKQNVKGSICHLNLEVHGLCDKCSLNLKND